MRDHRIDLLATVPLFQGLSRRDLKELIAAGRGLAFPAGRTIVWEDSIGSDFYLITSGRVRVMRSGRNVATLGPGDFFGEIAVIDQAPRTASVIAETDVSLFRLDRRAFLRLLDGNGLIARKVLVEMSRRVRERERRSVRL